MPLRSMSFLKRRRAIPIDDCSSNLAGVHARHVQPAFEPDARDWMDRAQLEAHVDGGWTGETRIHANVVEAAQAEQMRDRLAHRADVERLSHGGLDDGDEGGIGGFAAFDDEPDRGDGFSDEVIDRGVRGPGTEKQETTENNWPQSHRVTEAAMGIASAPCNGARPSNRRRNAKRKRVVTALRSCVVRRRARPARQAGDAMQRAAIALRARRALCLKRQEGFSR